MRTPLPLLTLSLPLLLLVGCNSTLNTIRANRFANTPQAPVEVHPQARVLGVATTPNGQSLTPASLDALNQLLVRQGRLTNQTLTLVPHTPAGERIAQRLGQTLENQGLPSKQLNVETLRLQKGTDDLTVVSEALVVQIPDCHIRNANDWALAPYTNIGSLGCASEANLAAMVSNPRDLVAPALLGPGEGANASGAVQRYQQHDMPKLIDMNFKNK